VAGGVVLLAVNAEKDYRSRQQRQLDQITIGRLRGACPSKRLPGRTPISTDSAPLYSGR
jgi:hypothetical protein